MDAYIGSIWSFGFTFAPVGYHVCDGALLSIAENQALFSLIGTTYGGDGQTTFAVPDLRGRVPIGDGQGPGLSNYVLGQSTNNANVTLISSNLPPHTHVVASAQIPVSAGTDSGDPTNTYFGVPGSTLGKTYETTGPVQMAASAGVTDPTGGAQPFNIQSPFQVVNYCICVEGIYPSRN